MQGLEPWSRKVAPPVIEGFCYGPLPSRGDLGPRSKPIIPSWIGGFSASRHTRAAIRHAQARRSATVVSDRYKNSRQGVHGAGRGCSTVV